MNTENFVYNLLDAVLYISVWELGQYLAIRLFKQFGYD